MPGSTVFDQAGAIGLRVRDGQDVITVNMVGSWLYNETNQAFTRNSARKMGPQPPACRRRQGLLLPCRYPDRPCPENRDAIPASPDAAGQSGTDRRLLQRLRGSGVDADFGKPKPLYKIATSPFYAAWATPVIHDTRWGLRINGNCQVIDMSGQVIPGLYCGGESAGGFSERGLARATCQGHIAGHHAVAG